MRVLSWTGRSPGAIRPLPLARPVPSPWGFRPDINQAITVLSIYINSLRSTSRQGMSEELPTNSDQVMIMSTPQA